MTFREVDFACDLLLSGCQVMAPKIVFRRTAKIGHRQNMITFTAGQNVGTTVTDRNLVASTTDQNIPPRRPAIRGQCLSVRSTDFSFRTSCEIIYRLKPPRDVPSNPRIYPV